MKVQPSLYNNAILKKGLKYASDNSLMCVAATSFALRSIIKPISIMLTPNVEKEDKTQACAKSISSGLVGLLTTALFSKPISKAIEHLNNNPKEYLKPDTIKNLLDESNNLIASKKYKFATQLFKLGLGVLIVAPKAYLTSKFMPIIAEKISPPKYKDEVSFSGNYEKILAKKIGKAINTKEIQNLSNKFANTNFEYHMLNLTDILATLFFILQTKKNKEIDKERKKPLIYNSAISTGLSITGGYLANKALEKPFENFIKKLTEANKNSPDLHKYIEGAKIAKTSLVLGGMYYILIPIISTFLADRLNKHFTEKS